MKKEYIVLHISIKELDEEIFTASNENAYLTSGEDNLGKDVWD